MGEREVALDLAQDTFLQVYKEIGKTSLDLPLDAWIYRIATNYGLRYLNRKRLRKFISFSHSTETVADDATADGYEEDNLFAFSASGPSLEDQAETRILVEQALAQLKPQDAICLQLHFSVGFTYEQIGRIMKTTPEAVRKRVSRGVEKFRLVYGHAALSNASRTYAMERTGRENKRQ